MMRDCRDCGRSFYADEHWKVRCIDCWKKSKRIEERREERAYSAGYSAGYAAGQAYAGRRQPLGSGLDSDTLRQAVVLCHPDRHPPGRFEQANAVTARLLELLNERQKAA